MKAIITVVGPDRVGIIAEVCTLLAELHISVGGDQPDHHAAHVDHDHARRMDVSRA